MKFKKTVSALLALLMIFTCCAPAFAAVEEKEALTLRFNDGVNLVKTELPYAVLTYTNAVPEGGITSGEGMRIEKVDEEVTRYLMPLLEGLFNNQTNMSQSFIYTLFGEAVSPDTTLLLKNGVRRDRTVPVYGKSWVSTLAPADDYEIASEQTADGELLTVSFADAPLEKAQTGSHAKAFSLPDGSIDPVILGSRDANGSTFLQDVRFLDFRIENASVTARLDAEGRAVYYKSTLDYCFSFTFYDVMTLVSAFFGYNFYTAVIAAVNVLLSNLNKDDISSEDVMRQSKLNIVYRCAVELDKINYAPRDFGDADGDGELTPNDARLVLRHSVGLTELKNAVDLAYCDLDFDGEITVEDARNVLRLAVGLDAPFHEVPEGKKIVIADLDALTAQDRENESDDGPQVPPQPPAPIHGTETSNPISEIMQGIFDIINSAKEIRDSAHGVEDEFV